MLHRAGLEKKGYKSHLVGQLLKHVSETRTVELAVASASPDFPDASYTQDSVKYYTIRQPGRFPVFGTRKADLSKCVNIIKEFNPDIIHVHGSEFFYGLVMDDVTISAPMVVSIQGLLGPCSKVRNFFGALTPIEVLKSIRIIEIPLRLGLVWQFLYMKGGARRESRILAAAKGIFGRTAWDLSYARIYNPQAIYCHVGEIMRPVFYNTRWSLRQCKRYTLIYTNAGNPRRGTENLLVAIALLKHDFPNIQLRLAGTVSQRSGYGRFLRRLVRKLGLENHVVFLGYLGDMAMARELQRAHVFAITSYIENSPNSLAEAMLTGMPCIASYVGGIPSMVDGGTTGLLYPAEDVPMLANCIRSIFVDDELSVHLADNAYRAAHDTHDPDNVVAQLLNAYNRILP
jgi:glycosyltransferase involved in cell wall biosynthesis